MLISTLLVRPPWPLISTVSVSILFLSPISSTYVPLSPTLPLPLGQWASTTPPLVAPLNRTSNGDPYLP